MDEQNLEFQAQEQAAPVIPETDTPIVTPTAQRRKRRKSKKQIFKEKYLPFIILGVSGMLCLSFIFGSISLRRERDAAKAKNDRITQLLQDEAESLKSRAAAMAAEYDYENAMKTLAGYSGGLASHSELLGLYNGYKAALNDLVVWDDLSKIPNLSFRTLMADLSKAAADPDRGSRYLKNYITTGEFSAILDQLYANGYVLVSLYDFAVPVTNEDGSVGVNRTSIRLPEGKKPIILTQEGVNYYSHTENCGGFADSLVVNASGELTCRLGDSEGAFDLVPVLNDFLAQHPDFSYEGARATIALSGYEGLFGMTLDQSDAIKAVADKLRAQGYDIACYTYADMEYADFGAAGIQEDLDKWNAEIVPVLGSTDMLVYPTGGDIKGQEAYTGSKYDALHGYGFRYFVGVANGTQWGMTTGDYARQTRTLVTGANLADHPDWFDGMFDAASVLSPDRG